jgi:hypothetical protein
MRRVLLGEGCGAMLGPPNEDDLCGREVVELLIVLAVLFDQPHSQKRSRTVSIQNDNTNHISEKEKKTKKSPRHT